MTTEMATREETRLNPQALIAQAIEKGAGMDTLERLVALAKDVRADLAREAWYESMAEFQRRCPPIRKTKEAKIQSSRGGYSYKYAPLDEILAVASPVLGTVGLSVSWRLRVEATQVVAVARIAHTLGHAEESGEIAIPIPVQGETGANPAQRVGIATTYARRYSLLGIIGMAPEDDDDGGGPEPRRETPREEPAGRDPHEQDVPGTHGGDAPITSAQLTAFHAIAGKSGWSKEQVHELLSGYQLNSSKDIPMRLFNVLTDRLKQGPEKGLKANGKQTSLA